MLKRRSLKTSNEETKDEDKIILHLTESMTNIEITIRRLLDHHDARRDERSWRLHLDQKKTIETTITQYIQSLNGIIAQERTTRTQVILEKQQQI